MDLSRRSFIRAGVVVGGVAAVSGAAGSLSAQAVSGSARFTTLQTVLKAGPAGTGGYRKVVTAAGEPHLVRTDLGVKAAAKRATYRRSVLAFAQLSDIHVVDHQSPARVEWTDRYDDAGPLPTPGLFASAYRPHEMLSAHVADAMVRQLNKVRTSPVTGAPLQFAIQTGDNSDNCQHNEIRWNIDVLDGRTITPDSGNPLAYEGLMGSANPLYYDPSYWHPDGPALGKTPDNLTAKHGFPTIKGLLDVSRKTFQPEGLDLEWYTAFGNHDGLIQGNFPDETTHFGLIATGPAKIVSPPAGVGPNNAVDTIHDPAALQTFLSDPNNIANGTVMPVTADTARRHLTRQQIVEEHFASTGLPVGHGFTDRNRADGTAYYSFDKGANGIVRCIVLDTVNPNGESNGSIDQAQMAWLTDLLAASADKVVLVFSHHTSESMDNQLVLTGLDPSPRVLGDEVLALLLAHPQVVAWVNGHTHRNQVWARPNADGTGGLWEINTASHIDYPQQSRLIEVVDNTDGTCSIFTTMVDHAGPADGGHATDTPIALASLSRELAVNDPQTGETLIGERNARNVELLVRAPQALSR